MLRVFADLTTTIPEPPAPPLLPSDELPLLEVPVPAPPPPLPVFAAAVEPALPAEAFCWDPPEPPYPYVTADPE